MASYELSNEELISRAVETLNKAYEVDDKGELVNFVDDTINWEKISKIVLHSVPNLMDREEQLNVGDVMKVLLVKNTM